MTRNPGFPISLDVKGRLCLVLGGDEEAAEKVQRLLDAGAKVTVINPKLNDTLRKLAAAAKVIHRPRLFRANDADGAVLIINTLGQDAEYSRSVLDVAQKERLVLCSVDQPDASNAFLPAVVSQGALRIAIGTSGASPALARRLREDLSVLFDERFARFVEWLGSLREKIQQGEPDVERRRAQLRQAVEGFALTGSVRYPDGWEAAAAAPAETPTVATPPPAAPSTKIRVS